MTSFSATNLPRTPFVTFVTFCKTFFLDLLRTIWCRATGTICKSSAAQIHWAKAFEQKAFMGRSRRFLTEGNEGNKG